MRKQGKTGRLERLKHEQNTVFKDWGGRLPVCLVYPNSYYLGMSSLGLHAIYNFLNDNPAVVCERAFWERDRQTDSPLTSLESGRLAGDFSVLAFTINYELDYFNIAAILRSANISLLASERDGRYPLVIGGGPCISSNPAPLAPLFDCLAIGEAEVILPDILSAITNSADSERDELLLELAKIPGILVPRYPCKIIKRQWLDKLDEYPVASRILTPDTEFGKLFMVEAERGCNWHCRFCMVSNTFSPVRYRSPEVLLEQIDWGMKFRRRVGLVGPDVSDYPHLEELTSTLRARGISIAVSSLRVKPFSIGVLDDLVSSGAKSIALGIEAGSERLRQLITKGINQDDIFAAVSSIAAKPVNHLKLYFMVGLPTENEEDIEDIIRLALACKHMLEKHRAGTRLSLNIAPFVPKANTPWQREPMAPNKILKQRIEKLKTSLIPQGIGINSESVAWSEVQAVLSRGDNSITSALMKLEDVSLPGWRHVTQAEKVDVDYFAHQKWLDTNPLPWQMIDAGHI